MNVPKKLIDGNFCGKKLTDEIKAQREEMQNSGIE